MMRIPFIGHHRSGRGNRSAKLLQDCADEPVARAHSSPNAPNARVRQTTAPKAPNAPMPHPGTISMHANATKMRALSNRAGGSGQGPCDANSQQWPAHAGDRAVSPVMTTPTARRKTSSGDDELSNSDHRPHRVRTWRNVNPIRGREFAKKMLQFNSSGGRSPAAQRPHSSPARNSISVLRREPSSLFRSRRSARRYPFAPAPPNGKAQAQVGNRAAQDLEEMIGLLVR